MKEAPIPIDVAVEDPLSEAIAKRLLTHTASGFAVGTTYRRGGFGYLRKTIRGGMKLPSRDRFLF